jgi:hypothetical protein
MSENCFGNESVYIILALLRTYRPDPFSNSITFTVSMKSVC